MYNEFPELQDLGINIRTMKANYHFPGYNEQSTIVQGLTHLLEYKINLDKYGYKDRQSLSEIEAQDLFANFKRSIKRN